MEDIILLIIITYGVALSLGYVLERYLKMPWMFTIVIFGMILSLFGLFSETIKSDEVQMLSRLGMLALLFIVGLDINLDEIRKLGKHIARGAILLTLAEGFLLALLFYFGFPAQVGNSFLIALIVGISFATVGEVILAAVLKEFGMTTTRFGQLALGMGILDNVIEILVLVFVVSLPIFSVTDKAQGIPDPMFVVLSLGGTFLLAFLIIKAKNKIKSRLEKYRGPPYVSPFLILLTFFSFVGLSAFVFEELGVVTAILGGIVVRQVFPDNILNEYKKPVNFLGYSFLAPFFFLAIGAKASLTSILEFPLVVAFIAAVSICSKVLASSLYFHKLIGLRPSMVLGMGLSIKFSTSLISLAILLDSGFISPMLFSAIIASYIVMKPIVTGVFSFGLSTIKGKTT